ncbi:MAG: efflux RND transporter periplasmic adaptor subunit [Pseudomonadota bacterium]
MAVHRLSDIDKASAGAMRDTAAQDRPIERRGRARWQWTVLIVVALAAGIGLISSANTWLRTDVSVPKERVRTAAVTRGLFVRDVAIQGDVVAAIKPTVFAPSAGRVRLQVRAGDRVTHGQALAEVASPVLDAELSRAKAALAEQQTQAEREQILGKQQDLANRQAVDLAEVAVTAAARELRRAEASWEYKVIALQDLEQARDELARAQLEYQHRLADAELYREQRAFEQRTKALSVEQQALAVAELQRQRDALNIVSPVDGIVGDLSVEDGAAVSADAALMTIVDLSQMELEVPLAQGYADDISVGMGATVSYAGQIYPAVVAAISPEVANNSVRTRLRFADAQPVGLRQNQRLTGRIEIERLDDVLMVPRGPFFDSGAGRTVYRIDGDFAVRTPIVSGAASAGFIQIIDGLSAGDEIVVSATDEFDGRDQILLTE